MRIGFEPAPRRMLDVPGHSQMNEEVPPALEFDNQILAATPYGTDLLSFESGSHYLRRFGARQAWIGDDDPFEPATRQARRQSLADRLDLG
jgi:hypothetical protein